ncbi:HD-GYP domain-containing protein [Agaribacterium haliotis]|uniref:HD-GYP domain-containing protein n=1 Tax=Agaribacterium haliotis TaxID=2013869 RepID=UPI000BB53F14|nr:HD-GYP domain-containing protein [Agaribacterium haliotis]
MSSKKIHVSELRPGMYVSKLDRDWLDTPFVMQGLLIESREDIEILSEYCEHLWIDVNPSQQQLNSSPVKAAVSIAPKVAPPYKTEIKEEHRRVSKTFKHARELTSSLLDEVRLGAAIDTNNAKDTVNGCVESVLRHPDAMMWMSKIREAREYTSDHCLNVCVISVAFGRHLGYSEEKLQQLGLCGLLHDVGKMRVPVEIIDKPAALTPKEYNLIKAHTVHGRNMLLEAKNIYAGAIDVAYSHHERVDGQGYPRKLKASDISRFSKIIAIVDAYDAMTADRVYSPAKTSTEALKIIYSERGKQFDDQLALEFIQTIGLYPAGSLVELYSGQIAFVVETNQLRRHLPKVILMLDKDKKPYKQEKLLDLSFIESGELAHDKLIKQVWVDGSFGLSIRDYQKRGLVLKRGFA